MLELIPQVFKLDTAFTVLAEERIKLADKISTVSSLILSDMGTPKKDFLGEIVSIVANINDHFVTYTKRGTKFWFLFDDHKCKKIGTFKQTLEDMASSSALPSVLLYRVKCSLFDVTAAGEDVPEMNLEESKVCDDQDTIEFEYYPKPEKVQVIKKLDPLHNSALTNNPKIKGLRMESNLITTMNKNKASPKKKNWVQKMLGMCGGADV
jgi:hypothetical protein